MRHYIDIVAKPRLVEVVLHTPVEEALHGYVQRAPNDAVRKWLLANFRNWLLKQPQNLHKLPYLPADATDKQKKAFEFDDLYDVRLAPVTRAMLDHIMDFFASNPNLPRLDRMSVEEVNTAADQWVKRMSAKALKEPDNPNEVKTMMELPGDFRVVELVGNNALAKEGALMGHCVGGSHYCELVASKTRRIFSLRDPSNKPHATIEVSKNPDRTVQIKGRGNMAPIRRYWPMLRAFLDQYKIAVDQDHLNVGLIRLYDPATGKYEVLTQEQFDDIVKDQGNERGQHLLSQIKDERNLYSHNEEVALALFNATYGTDRLTDVLVRRAFASFPNHALQTIEHYGNRLTSNQMIIAIDAATGHRLGEGYWKAFVTATKPPDDVIEHFIEWRRLAGHFIVAVAQIMPDSYRRLVAGKSLDHELEFVGDRSAAPFYAFIGSDKPLTPEMFEKAFEWTPKDALRAVQRHKITLSDNDTVMALRGTRKAQFELAAATVDRLIEYAKPDAKVLADVFDNDTHGSTFITMVLNAARRHVPESVDKTVVERAAIASNSSKLIVEYLQGEEHPSPEFQRHLFERAETENDPGILVHLKNPIPELYRMTLETLRPKPVRKTKTVNRFVKDSSHPHGKNIAYEQPLTDQEKTQAERKAQRDAISKFVEFLAPLLSNSQNHKVQALDPNAPKFKMGQKIFTEMGKDKLFDLAVRLINRGNRFRDVMMKSGADVSVTFIKNLPHLSDKQIASILNHRLYAPQNSLFVDLVDSAPERVPGVLATKIAVQSPKPLYGKLEWNGLNKAKTFDALEHVWAAPKVPEGIKTDFTTRVFKRFKPNPDRLMDMLQRAKNKDATRYVLKKTKKPSDELLNFVLDTSPDMLVDSAAIAEIPNSFLPTIFDKNLRLAAALMDRDLRGRAQSRYGQSSVHANLKRDSETFAKYEKAAKQAGKEQAFQRYVQQAQLDELVPDMFEHGKLDVATLRKHLDDFSNQTLIAIAHRDKSNAALRLYFEKFSAKKLAILLNNKVFVRYQHDDSAALKRVDQDKLRDAVLISLQRDYGIADVLEAMTQNGFDFDDAMIKKIIDYRGGGSGKLDSVRSILLAKPNLSDDIKDYVADHLPQKMGDVKNPNAYMIKKLFDKYGKFTRNYKGATISVDYFFRRIVQSWFSTDAFHVDWQDNPGAYRLLKDEAKRRGGVAAKLALTMFRHLATMKKKKLANQYVSALDEPTVAMLPRGYKAEKE